MTIKSDLRVEQVFNNYPDFVQTQLIFLRKLLIDVASEIPEINELEETLKWGEPSYISQFGSTIRMDWKAKSPNQYALYFKCTSKLVPTFKLLFADTFQFEGDRAIIFDLDAEIPELEVKKCLYMGLMYHKIKHLHLLGMENKL